MGIKHFKLFVIFSFISLALSGQELTTIFGTISDTAGYSVGFANLAVPGSKFGSTADRFGQYSIQVPKGTTSLIVTCVGYQNEKVDIAGTTEKKARIDIVLKSLVEKLEEVKVSSRSETSGTLQRIDSRNLSSMPNLNGGIENIIKQMPGVASNNELSSQYSVRGGNFDENLVYVNNIEVYKPMLIQSGQQEGLSFVNPDLVGSVKFSAGGFDATYGDKMSSVLDINYKRPTENTGSAYAGILGGAAHYEGVSKNQKFRHLTGFRYKTSKYLLNSLDTKGEYNPSFFDFQTYLTYDITPKFEVSFLGNYGQNTYDFVPTDRETEFGTFQLQRKLRVYFEGKENDIFENAMGAFTLNFHPSENASFKLIGSAYTTTESETYDILGQYNISELNQSGKSSQNDSAQIIGVGSFLNHARDYLDTKILSLSQVGFLNLNKNKLKWGVTLQQEVIHDNSNEWNLVDSAGYLLPNSISGISLQNARHSKYDLNSERLMAYVQNSLEVNLGEDKIFITAGLRSNYWSLNNQLIFNPRLSLSYKPQWKPNLLLYVSAGYYNQPPFYKELLDASGNINTKLKAQNSIHFVLGADYIFYTLSRPFKLTTEVYYKSFDNLVPYRVDNVRIIYSGANIAKGFAEGIDVKINGEFVKGTESWLSLSLLNTEEAIKTQYLSSGSEIYLPGYYSRPTDQFLNMSLYFQDYLPKYPSYKVHLSAHYGSELPVSIPMSNYWNNVKRILPSYKRVDIGISKLMKGEENTTDYKALNFFKEVWISAEIFNVLGIDNTVSFLWVKSVSNLDNAPGYFAVPNYLTGRRLNLKITANF